METIGNAQTEAQADGRTRVLLLDGHSSHYSYDFSSSLGLTTLSFLAIHFTAHMLFKVMVLSAWPK